MTDCKLSSMKLLERKRERERMIQLSNNGLCSWEKLVCVRILLSLELIYLNASEERPLS
jgi:hypothetical protein